MIGTAYAGSITVAVHEQTQVKGPLLTLGELADISGDDSDRVAALQALKLGSAPLPGESIVLTNQLIFMRLSAYGADFADVTWQMPEKLTISTLSQLLIGQSVADCTIQAVKQQLGTTDDITIEAIGLPKDTNYAIGELTLKPELPRNIRYNGPTIVKVNVNIDGRQVASETVKLNIKMYKEVVVAAKTVLSHETFTEDSIKLERMDISRLPHGFLTDINSAVGLTARRIISPGMVLCNTMLEKPVVVKRGNKVTIIARVGGTEITAPGQAMQDGTENQIIKVQNLNSQKIISAKIIDSSSVLATTYNGK
jgi:flagella basal body P-ring formation protein FlgA